MAIIETWSTGDLRPGRASERWHNLLYSALVDAIEERGTRLRALTSDYLDVTDPFALRRLLLLAERGADVRLFEAGSQSLHLKANVCVRCEAGETLWGRAFIGSSNISRPALTDGLEWNVRIDRAMAGQDAECPQEIRREYEALFRHPCARTLDHDWIDGYEERRQDVGGDDQYLLRLVTKDADGRYRLRAANPDYPDLDETEGFKTLARLKAILDPRDVERSIPICRGNSVASAIAAPARASELGGAGRHNGRGTAERCREESSGVD